MEGIIGLQAHSIIVLNFLIAHKTFSRKEDGLLISNRG